MDFRVFYVLLSTVLPCYSEGCHIYSDKSCSYTLSCVGSFTSNDAESAFEPYMYSYPYGNYYDEECTTFVEYEQNKFYHVYLVLLLNNSNKTMLIPNTLDSISEERLNIIYSLDISLNNYTESPVIRSMQNLAIIIFSYNYLTTAVLTNDNELAMLTEINFSHNKINEIKLKSHQHLPKKLTKIDLSYNKLENIPDNIFEKFEHLQTLDFSNNNIEIISQFAFKGLTKLSNLNLSNNKIRSIHSYLFKDTSISLISFTENKLEDLLASGMFEGLKVSMLDLSNQSLTGVKDYAFQDLVKLNTLLLNANNIYSLSNMCFKTLLNLKHLDLSKNQIISIDFNTEDLGNLQLLLLKNNRLTEIKHEQLLHLNNLELLDLSENQIIRIEPKSFQSLRSLVNLKVHNNALTGPIETNEFDGLALISSLDLSNYILTSVQNASFNDMFNLKEVNMSTNDIGILEYNVFAHTGNIETLDLSYNKLQEFAVNTTELNKLVILLLNNNVIKIISSDSFSFLFQLDKMTLSHNTLEYIHNDSFNSLNNLRFLDLSYNKNISDLIFSGNESAIEFVLTNIKISSITHLVTSHAGIQNVNELNLDSLMHLDNWDLSHNNISNLRIGAFTELTKITYLDLSFNNIFFIQPSVFAHNNYLKTLNISHNMLSSVSYGMFRGLTNLDVLDMSYNNIKSLRGEVFYELKLKRLIVDHNKIDNINVIEFKYTQLETLSIGNNPIPCQVLVQLIKNSTPFTITAIEMEEHHENVDGVICNKRHTIEPKIITDAPDKLNISYDTHLLNMLHNLTNRNTEPETSIIQSLEKITNILEKSNLGYNEKLNNLVNLTSTGNAMENNSSIETNILLNTIVKLLQQTTTTATSHEKDVKDTDVPSIGNDSHVIHTTEINTVFKKTTKDFDYPKFEMHDNLNNTTVSNYPTEYLTSNDHDKLVANDKNMTFSYTEIGVSVILISIVGVILYKFYKHKTIIRNRFFPTSHELPDSMENSSL